MHKFTEKLKKMYHSPNFPFFLFLLLLIILHVKILHVNGDDIYFSNILQETNQGLFGYLQMRYTTWTSRILIEGMMVFLLKYQLFIWRILNIGMFLLLAKSISKITNSQNHRMLNYAICGGILLIPMTVFNETGWVATTMNYLWVIALGTYAISTVKDAIEEKKISWWKYPLYIAATLYACNQEQVVMILLAIWSCFLLYQLFTKKIKYVWKHNKLLCMQWLIAILSLLFIMTCPGNKQRSLEETQRWYPEYASFQVIEKMQLGLTATMKPLVLHINWLFILFTGLLWIGVCKSRKRILDKWIAAIPLIGATLFTLFKEQITSVMPRIMQYVNIFDQEHLIMPLNNFALDEFLVFCAYIVILLVIGIDLYFIFGKHKTTIIAIGIYTLGLMSRMMMGFSPTIFASGMRTFLCLYVVLIIEIIILIPKIGFLKKKEGVEEHGK